MIGWIMYVFIWMVMQPFRRLFSRWKIIGIEHLPPRPHGFVLATNHIHWLDILVVGASMPLAYNPWWIAKVELLDNRMAAWFFRQMRFIPIKRGRRDLTAMTTAEDVLKQGYVLVVFTEGTRNPSGALQEGRGGAVRLAVRSGQPIVPAAIAGTEAGWKVMFRRAPISITFGEPYHPQAEDGSIPFNRMNELTDEMMLRIAAMLPEERWGFYRERMLQSR